MFSKIKDAITAFSSKKKISKEEVNELLKEIKRALLLADVNVRVVMDLSKKIEKRIYEEKPDNVSLKEHVIKSVYDVLVEVLGKEPAEIKIGRQRIMLIGLYGAGKTTTTAKLANYFKKKNLSVCVVALDVHRPAAYEQLKHLADSVGVGFYGEKNNNSALDIAKNSLDACKDYDVVIYDTAGRDNIDDELLKELSDIYEVVKPDEVLLVVPGDIGQVAKNLVEGFNKQVPITGLIVTRMDTSAKAGGALTSAYLANAPIKFIGVGEKIDDLEFYDPVGFVSRMLGMGDLRSLLEKIKELEQEQKTIQEMLEKGEYNMLVFYEQLKATQKMGSLQKIMDLVPGMSRLNVSKSQLEEQERQMKKWKYIIDSMTVEERLHPEIINASRIARIAKGSGTSEEDVRGLIKAYKMSEKMFKKFKSGKFMKDPRIRKMLQTMDFDEEALKNIKM